MEALVQRLTSDSALTGKQALVDGCRDPLSFWTIGMPMPHALRKSVEAQIIDGKCEIAHMLISFAVELHCALTEVRHAVPIVMAINLQMPYMVNRVARAFPAAIPTLRLALQPLQDRLDAAAFAALMGSVVATLPVPAPPSPPRIQAGAPVLQPPTMALHVSHGVIYEGSLSSGALAQAGRASLSVSPAYTPLQSKHLATGKMGHVEPGRIDARTREFLRRAAAIIASTDSIDGEEGGSSNEPCSNMGKMWSNEHAGRTSVLDSSSEDSGIEDGLGTEGHGIKRAKRPKRDHIIDDRDRYMANAFHRFGESRDLRAAGQSSGGPSARTERAGIGASSALQ